MQSQRGFAPPVPAASRWRRRDGRERTGGPAATDHVKSSVGIRKVEHIAFLPLQLGSNGASDCKHPGVDVQTDHSPAPSSFGNQTCHDASAAGNVQDAIAGLRGSQVHKLAGPWTENRRDKKPFVVLSCAPDYLPLLVQLFPPSDGE